MSINRNDNIYDEVSPLPSYIDSSSSNVDTEDDEKNNTIDNGLGKSIEKSNNIYADIFPCLSTIGYKNDLAQYYAMLNSKDSNDSKINSKDDTESYESYDMKRKSSYIEEDDIYNSRLSTIKNNMSSQVKQCKGWFNDLVIWGKQNIEKPVQEKLHEYYYGTNENETNENDDNLNDTTLGKELLKTTSIDDDVCSTISGRLTINEINEKPKKEKEEESYFTTIVNWYEHFTNNLNNTIENWNLTNIRTSIAARCTTLNSDWDNVNEKVTIWYISLQDMFKYNKSA